MARPPRADEASTRHVGFRLTDDEIERLDNLVTEHGLRDRSALLRAWLEQGGTTAPTPRTDHRQTPRTTAKVTRSSKPVAVPRVEPRTERPRHPRIITTPRVMESSPSSDASSHVETNPKSIMRELLAELNRHRGELLIGVADVVRALLPHASMQTVHDALLTLNKNGLIELRPDGGSEFLRPEDAAVCPRGPRETVFAYARWTDTR